MPRRKRINFFKALKKKFQGIPSLYENKMGNGLIAHPIEMYKSLKFRAKGSGFKGGKHKKHASRHALGKAIRARVMNGPELNIVLLGIPMLIDFAVSYGQKVPLFSKEVPDHPQHNQEEVVVLKFDENADTNSEVDVDLSELDPLPSAPYSDVALRLYAKLVENGMSEKAARKICSGELNGEELEDHLSDEDVAVFIGLYGTVFKEGVTEV